MKVLDISLWVDLVEESPAVLSRGPLCKELGFFPGRQRGAPTLKRENKIIDCELDDFVPVIAVIKHQENPKYASVFWQERRVCSEETDETRHQLQRILALSRK